MPHIVIEYSANLERHTDIAALVRATHDAAAATGAFALETIRTRAERRDVYCIADGDPRNAFVAIVGRIAPGRPEALRHSIGRMMFEAVQSHLRAVLEEIPLSLTLELHDIDQTAAFRQNTIKVAPTSL